MVKSIYKQLSTDLYFLKIKPSGIIITPDGFKFKNKGYKIYLKSVNKCKQ